MEGAFYKVSLNLGIEKGWFCFTVLTSKGYVSAVVNTENFPTAAALPCLASSVVPKLPFVQQRAAT